MASQDVTMNNNTDSNVLPCPHFEGVEKRIEIDFHAGGLQRGLRSLPRDTLDDAMTAAECLIVSKRSCDAFDAYVLSESSLFVYPTKVVLKTCGTTKLLKAIPMFIEEAAKLGMKPRRAKYTRSTFMWPDEQPLEGDFDREVDFLETHFGALGDGGNAFVLGSKTKGVQWHVYLADDNSGGASLDGNNSEGSECSTGGLETHVPAGVHRANQPDPTVSLEVCMTHLDRTHSKHFFRDDTYESCQQTTKACGISDLFPKFDIDPYVFEPCGYSMNGLSGAEYSTIHITPEDGFSYCSVERSNIPVSMADPEDYLRRVASTFKPGKFSFAVSTDAALAGGNLAGIVPRGIYSNEDDNNEVPTHQLTKFPSTVFGPTCDGIDKVLENTQLPEVNVGDWLVFPHMGAYTVSAGSNFNGFECGSVRKYYVASIVDGDPDEIRR